MCYQKLQFRSKIREIKNEIVFQNSLKKVCSNILSLENSKEETKTKRCVAYCRVSTNSKDQENSFENQKSYFSREIERNKGCKLVHIYADKGLTGTKFNNRPEFNQLLLDAGIDVIKFGNKKDKRNKKQHIIYEVSDRKPKFEEIWIKNTSRFARNTLSYDIIVKLREKGVIIRFIEQNLNTKDLGNDLVLQIFQLFDAQDSRDKSNKVSTGIREGALKGKISANNRLFGYKYIISENRLKIIPHEAKIIQKIFELYSQGLGIRRIIKYLTNEGIFTRQGKPFCKSTIKRILSNEKYAGINIRLKYDTGIVFSKKAYPQIKPEEEWINNGKTEKIPAIIDEELFYKCKKILESKVNYLNQKNGKYKGVTKFAGLVTCGKCGSSYISNVDRGRRFYNCSRKKNQGVLACNNKNISEKALLNLVKDLIYYDFRKEIIEEGKKQLLTKRKEYENLLNETPVNKIDDLKRKIKDINSRVTALFYLYKGDSFKEQLQNAISDLEMEKQALEQELQKYINPKETAKVIIKEIDEAINRVDEMGSKQYSSEDDMLENIKEIAILPDNRIKVVFKIFICEMDIELDDLSVVLKHVKG